MSGPIVRKYGFPNHEQIFGKRPLEHGAEPETETKSEPDAEAKSKPKPKSKDEPKPKKKK